MPPDLVLEPSDLTASRIHIILLGSEAPIEVSGAPIRPVNVLRKDNARSQHTDQIWISNVPHEFFGMLSNQNNSESVQKTFSVGEIFIVPVLVVSIQIWFIEVEFPAFALGDRIPDHPMIS